MGNFKLGVKKQPPKFPQGDDKSTAERLEGINPGDLCAVFRRLSRIPLLPKPKNLTIETGVIVLATGFKSYVPRQRRIWLQGI